MEKCQRVVQKSFTVIAAPLVVQGRSMGIKAVHDGYLVQNRVIIYVRWHRRF